MSVNVALKNPASGEVKFIKVGFSWALFFFANVLGIPLFARKLYRWGFALLSINIAALVVPMLVSRNAGVACQVVAFLGQIVLIFLLGFKGNEMTAKHWLARGWRFAEPQSEAARYAKMKWQIFDAQAGEPSEAAPSTAASAS